MMCPDHQLLSVYLDGELPSPWKEKMESHLAECPDCARRLENYRLVAGATGEQAENLQGAKDRVWQKLAEGTRFAEQAPVEQRQPRLIARRGIWRRRVAVPLPAAAAAVILFVVAATLVFTGRASSVGHIPNMTFSTEDYIPPAWFDGTTGFDMPGYPITDMNGVLQYLGSRDSGDILILRLPEARNFTSSGEPAIIRAADYSRRKP